MDNLIEDVVGTATSTFTPFGCVRNCAALVMFAFLVYFMLVMIFIFIQ